MCAQQIWAQRYKNYFTCTNFSAENHNFSTFCNQNRIKKRDSLSEISLLNGAPDATFISCGGESENTAKIHTSDVVASRIEP